ncbi:MAG TPA: glycoside hydrolase family 3 N-terminal domain-containing protein [Candidatus Sulfotelmatobacter sp.]|nr:glycoside hydrolase family 3 N-terminal domain-containing protein [Candidatus Sulfotelmatobacter sp.]
MPAAPLRALRLFRLLSRAAYGRAAVLLVVALLCSCSTSLRLARTPGATPSPRGTSKSSPSATPRPATLPLDLALGQLFAASFGGPSITPGLRHLILDEKVGAVLLFKGNFGNSAGLSRLVAQLRELGHEAGLPKPLLVTLDEEGGGASQVTDVANPAAARTLGTEGPNAVRNAYATLARALRALGVDVDLAPVADVRVNSADDVIRDRAFGSDPGTVAPLVAAAVAGLHDGALGATLKHFPGLGAAAGDPHRALPTDPVSEDEWRARSAPPFRAGIAAGADAVMTTAVSVPGLDPSATPAMFSPAVVTGLLREQLGFHGVIITDSLSLGGITARYPLPAAALGALQAGNDLLLLSNADTAYEARAIDAVRQAVQSGALPVERIEMSASRILALPRSP